MSDGNLPIMQPGSLRTISDAKLVNFALGQQKKTRFQKIRDAKEQKEKQEAEEAAIVFKSFAASFNEQEDDVKTFVRSGASGSGSGGAVYRVSKSSEMDKLMNEMKERDAIRETASTSLSSKNNRQIDQLLTEMKASHSGASDKYSSDYSSVDNNVLDNNDSTTTNIYLGSLAPSVTEKGLYDLFSHFGAINSIKIMWPRNEDDRSRKVHCGFVSFKRRTDAEAAMAGLLDFEYHGIRMTMNWGKAVKVTNEPYYVPLGGHSSLLSSPAPPAFSGLSRPGITGMPAFASPPVVKSISEVSDKELSGMSVDNLLASVRQTVEPTPRGITSSDVSIQVIIPKDSLIRGVIDSTAKAVAAGGLNHENIIRKQTMNAKHYEFLRNPEGSDDWWYYQWRTHAYILGENDFDWSMKPFQQRPDGPFLIPPESGIERNAVRGRSNSPDPSRSGDNTNKTGAQMERERTKRRNIQMAKLNNNDYKEWKTMLCNLTLARTSIKEAMGFAFDKIESSDEVVAMIKDVLIFPSKSAAAKIAGLYLLSDILHNSGSSIKLAAHYRAVVQSIIPEVIENLAELLRNTKGRMSAHQIEDRVKKVFAVWADWSIFPTLFLVGLQALFYFNESECTSMQQYITKKSAENLAPLSEHDLEVLRKRAKATGIAHTDATSSDELHYKLDFIERYSKNALNSLTVINAAIPEATSIPIVEEIVTASATAPQVDIDGVIIPGSSDAVDDINGAPLVDEDVDGVPINDFTAVDVIDGTSMDDIDGAPIDDVDGIPLDDIDGIPMDVNHNITLVPVPASEYDEDIDGVPM